MIGVSSSFKAICVLLDLNELYSIILKVLKNDLLSKCSSMGTSEVSLNPMFYIAILKSFRLMWCREN